MIEQTMRRVHNRSAAYTSGLTLLASALVAIGLACPVAAVASGECEPRPKCFSVETVEGSLSTTQAGAHPDLAFTFDLSKDPESTPNPFNLKDAYSLTKTVRIDLPAGLVGNPNVLGVPQQCTVAELEAFSELNGGCPNGSQVGLTKIYAYDLPEAFLEPVYMMVPPGGDVVARLGFIAGIFPTFVDFRVRSESDYGLTAEIVDAPTAARLIRAETTTWGVPSDRKHDEERCTAAEVFISDCTVSPSRHPGSRPLAFLTNPTRCGVPLSLGVSAASWAEPERFDTKSTSLSTITGCDELPFGPGLEVEPTSHQAASPSGLEVTISLPSPEGVETLEPSQIREAKIDMPAGVTVNPGAADGLEACSPEQVGFGTRNASKCPDGAKLADTEFDIPALPRRMKGAIYLREPVPGNLFRIWIVADDLGAHVKLPAQLNIDEATGQIKSVVSEVPQVPVKEIKLLFKSGFRAPLATPASCGTYQTHYEFTPWSGNHPVSGDTPMQITQGCDTGGFKPLFTAGTTSTSGGGFSPFLFDLTRNDGEQNPETLEVNLPSGLVAKLAGVPLCEGEDAATGKCSAASKVGHIVGALGVGPAPLWVPQAGKSPTAAYLGGPYKGAPFSLIVVVPAQAGPFDLGNVVVRSAIYVDPVTAQVTVKSDLLPQILQGIPLTYRHVQVAVDKPEFILNPTNCEQLTIASNIKSSQGTTAGLSTPFQVTNCAKLALKPKFVVSTAGRTSRKIGASLNATLSFASGSLGSEANLKSVKVSLPKQLPSRLTTLQKACPDSTFTQNPASCPQDSKIGTATAVSPIVPVPLTGPAYFVSHGGAAFPELIVVLQGYGITVDLHGETFISKAGITSSTFHQIPDVPVSTFNLNLPQGPDSALAANGNLCQSKLLMPTVFTAQNGLTLKQNTHITTTGCPKKKTKHKAKKASHRANMHKRGKK
jgi:hypothetical protein